MNEILLKTKEISSEHSDSPSFFSLLGENSLRQNEIEIDKFNKNSILNTPLGKAILMHIEKYADATKVVRDSQDERSCI